MKRTWAGPIVWLAALLSTAAQAGTVTYYHNDLAGSPAVATNSSGAVIWRESYRPYGERLTNAPASAANDVWFTSRRQDAETGLVYMGARYYDPVAGRFNSMDPKGFDEANVHTFNRYAYAANNPYKFYDPDGQRFEFVNNSSGSFKADVSAMRRYVEAAGASAVFSQLEQRSEVIYVQEGSPGVMDYNFDTKTITIDPRSGNRLADGTVQSPALGFLHEAAHALQDVSNKKQFEVDRRTRDSTYDTKEERRVIEQVETPAAKKLGEPTRSDHRVKHHPVGCATCTE